VIDDCYQGDVRAGLRAFIAAGIRAQTCVTSPPYWGLRDYGVAGQLGLEPTISEYVAGMVEVFALVRDVLADDGTLWLNLGDSYANGTKWGGSTGGKHAAGLHGASGIGRQKVTTGLKAKDLCGIPWRVAFALQADGWYLRSDIIWHKPNPMPESITDRPTKSHEYLFLLSKRERYYFDAESFKEPTIGNTPHDLTGGYASAPGQKPQSGSRANYKTPDGWDTSKGAGGHGSFHKEGREAGHTGYVSKSGNRERKPASARGVPIETDGKSGGGVAGSVPWEGSMRNRRTVWTIATESYSEAHFATYPRALVEPCILAGSRPGDVVLDPFMGSGTTAQVAQDLGRRWIGCELNPAYIAMQARRTAQRGLALEIAAGDAATATRAYPARAGKWR